MSVALRSPPFLSVPTPSAPAGPAAPPTRYARTELHTLLLGPPAVTECKRPQGVLVSDSKASGDCITWLAWPRRRPKHTLSRARVCGDRCAASAVRSGPGCGPPPEHRLPMPARPAHGAAPRSSRAGWRQQPGPGRSPWRCHAHRRRPSHGTLSAQRDCVHRSAACLRALRCALGTVRNARRKACGSCSSLRGVERVLAQHAPPAPSPRPARGRAWARSHG